MQREKFKGKRAKFKWKMAKGKRQRAKGKVPYKPKSWFIEPFNGLFYYSDKKSHPALKFSNT
jgi:hypothetical protein